MFALWLLIQKVEVRFPLGGHLAEELYKSAIRRVTTGMETVWGESLLFEEFLLLVGVPLNNCFN